MLTALAAVLTMPAVAQPPPVCPSRLSSDGRIQALLARLARFTDETKARRDAVNTALSHLHQSVEDLRRSQVLVQRSQYAVRRIEPSARLGQASSRSGASSSA